MVTPSEQQLFKRITRLTLILGILIGMYLVFLGVMFYDFFIASRSVDDLLPPLSIFLLGSIWVLRWKVQSLRSHFPALRDNSAVPDSWRYFGLLGLLMMGLPVFALIERVMNLPDVVEYIVSIGGLIALCLILGAELYREVRRVAER